MAAHRRRRQGESAVDERRRAARGQARLHLRRRRRRRQDDHLGGDRARDGGARGEGRGRDDRPGAAARERARARGARERAPAGRARAARGRAGDPRRAVGDDARPQADLRRADRPGRARSERAAEIKANRVYRELSTAVSGSQEFTAIAKLFDLDREGDFDLLVLDTPPSRNALDFLDAPGRLTAFLEGRALKAFLRPTGLGMRVLGRGAAPLLAGAAAGHRHRPDRATCRRSSGCSAT